MKASKKGFTLIELLAVIVILAIIALIATPVVLNLINNAKKGAFARSAEQMLKASKLYYSSSLLDVKEPETITFNCSNNECISDELDSDGNNKKLDIEGNIGDGKVTIDNDGNISFDSTDNNYCSYKYATDKIIHTIKGSCEENNIDVVHDTIIPTITYKMTNSTSNSIIIGYDLEDDMGISNVICTYGTSIDNLNLNGESSLTACKLNNLMHGTYYYKICAKDVGMNETSPCLTGSAQTTEVQKPTIIWQGYNKVSSSSVESINGYVYKDEAIVNYNNTNIEIPNNYIKTSVDTTSNIGITKMCGTGNNPTECTDIPSSTNLTAGTWYKIGESINIEFSTKGEIYLYTYDETGNNAYYSGSSRSIDRTGPTIILEDAITTPYTIKIPITSIADSDAGIIQNKKCMVGTGDSYTEYYGMISEDGTECLISGLQSSADYNYRIYAEDGLGNSNQKDGQARTKAAIAGTPTIVASWPDTTSIKVDVSGMTIDSSDTVSYRYSINGEVKQDWTTNNSYTYTSLTSGSSNTVLVETKATSGGDLGNKKQTTIYTSKTVTGTNNGYSTNSACTSSTKTIAASGAYSSVTLKNPSCSSYTETQSKYCSTSRNGYSSCSSTRTCSLSGGSGSVPLTDKTEGEKCTTSYKEECTTKTDSSCMSDCDDDATACLREYLDCESNCSCPAYCCRDNLLSCQASCDYEDCEDVPYEDCDTYYYCDYGGYIDVSVTLYKAIYSGVVTPSQTNY